MCYLTLKTPLMAQMHINIVYRRGDWCCHNSPTDLYLSHFKYIVRGNLILSWGEHLLKLISCRLFSSTISPGQPKCPTIQDC